MKSLIMKPVSIACAALLLVVVLPVLPQQVSKTFVTAEAQTRRRIQRPSYTDSKVIAVGTNLRLRLNTGLSSKEARLGDTFTATVLSPSRFEEATLHGHISSIQKSGKIQGRTSMTLAFNSIETRDGRKGTLHGYITRVYGSGSGQADEEGGVESSSRGKQALKRGGIGAAAGAIIGGIAGGGKGAAIGLILGGAGGAGSLAVQGSKELKIESGTEMLVHVTR